PGPGRRRGSRHLARSGRGNRASAVHRCGPFRPRGGKQRHGVLTRHPTSSRVFYPLVTTCAGPRSRRQRTYITRWNDYCNIIGVKTWVTFFDLSQSPSGSEPALLEKPERSTTASFRRLIPSASSGTR